jgi:hypothetical protein
MWRHAETSVPVKAIDDTLEGRDSPALHLASCNSWQPGYMFPQLWRSLRFVTLSAGGPTLSDSRVAPPPSGDFSTPWRGLRGGG